jgi:hypothetical protein
VRLERLFPNVNYAKISQGNLENEINQLLYSPRVAVFPNVNSVQSLTLPADARTILVKAWGAGGGAGTVGGWVYGADGGGGGYSTAIINGVSGTLGVVTGQQGYRNQGAGSGFGGGRSASNNNVDNRYGAGGGGYSGVFSSTTINQANALVIAGGGGGGGSSRAGTGNAGGAGGGSTAQDGFSPYDSKTSYAGRAGTQLGAGADSSCDSANTAGGQGALLGGQCRLNCYGGGGGGGYWGGSAGGYSEANTMGGGGGGSGFIVSGAIASSNLTGSARTPAGTSDVSYPKGLNAGYGGVANASDGIAGFVVIYY